MRHDWTGWEFLDSQLYEDDVIRFQVYLENGFLRVAEALVKYRAIHLQAGRDIAKQMDGVTERFTVEVNNYDAADVDTLKERVGGAACCVGSVERMPSRRGICSGLTR